MVLVKVKHGKTSHEVELDQTKTVKDFKSALQAITNVPPERQTLMGKGVWIGTLKDDKDLSTLKVKPGQLITLMGSADVLKEVPKNVRDRCVPVPTSLTSHLFPSSHMRFCCQLHSIALL